MTGNLYKCLKANTNCRWQNIMLLCQFRVESFVCYLCCFIMMFNLSLAMQSCSKHGPVWQYSLSDCSQCTLTTLGFLNCQTISECDRMTKSQKCQIPLIAALPLHSVCVLTKTLLTQSGFANGKHKQFQPNNIVM